MNRVVVTLPSGSAGPKGVGCKNCNKMKNEDQISTYVRWMTDDADND
jgi:hypothetical protein